MVVFRGGARMDFFSEGPGPTSASPCILLLYLTSNCDLCLHCLEHSQRFAHPQIFLVVLQPFHVLPLVAWSQCTCLSILTSCQFVLNWWTWILSLCGHLLWLETASDKLRLICLFTFEGTDLSMDAYNSCVSSLWQWKTTKRCWLKYMYRVCPVIADCSDEMDVKRNFREISYNEMV